MVQAAWEEYKVEKLGPFLALHSTDCYWARVVTFGLVGQDGWGMRCPKY